jgi:ferredoxin-nitrite reductase
MRFITPYRTVGELNQIEQWKLERHPLEIADAIIDRYSVEGPAAIATVPGEVERLKWAGIYPQKQGGDNFMMRVKVPGGFLTAPQIREIGVVADAFGEGPDGSESRVFGSRYADLTTRQSIQIHWLRIEDIPRIWRRFAAVGVSTVQACGDSARNVLCCPVSGIDADEAFNALPVAQAVSAFFGGNREYANLPRKFKISITGCTEDCAQAEINDIGLWPARSADGELGFNVLAGGGLSDGERMASDLDIFVRPDQAVELCRAIAQTFGELGNRENRGLARMRYLVQELGPEGFRSALADRAAFDLVPAGTDLTRRYRGDHVGVHPQKQPGLVYVGCSVPVGRMSGLELVEVARLAETYGDGTVRLSTDQNFTLTGVPEDRLDALLGEELLAKYSPFPGPFSRGVVACTGSEFCRFAIVETKERAVKWARFLDEQLAGEPVGAAPRPGERSGVREDAGVVRMHFSGCSASCAQPQIADIGFRGEIAKVGTHLEEAVDIGMGGSLGAGSGFIDWIEHARPVNTVPNALLRVVRRYQSERGETEPFYNWARRVPDDELRRTLAAEGVGLEEPVDEPPVRLVAVAPATKSPVKKAAAKKAPAKKSPSRKAAAKKAPAKKSPVKKAAAKKAPAKKSPATKSPSKKAAAKKAPATRKRVR